ncbi:hypothetical protein MNBD_GAMMA26-2696 [hydrothermal vent metagenome]|uniref:Uncharacterized protein n=1 Tax=hydrothermal vent metagenome TaxID=652676 RepID=A0A3B1BGI0_9ZZZZ
MATTDVTVLAFDYERSMQDLKFFPRVISKLNLNISRVLGERLAAVVAELP